MNESSNSTLEGWVSSPDTRGTIDILWSNGITLILCSWTVLCLNCVDPSWGRWRQGWRKFLMACLTFIGPEFTFQLAIGQWCSACRSVEKFRSSGYDDWTMRHAFFADMGGFALQPQLSASDSSVVDWVPFPLDAQQLHYLVVNNYIPYSKVGPPGVSRYVDSLLTFDITGMIFELGDTAPGWLTIHSNCRRRILDGLDACTKGCHFTLGRVSYQAEALLLQSPTHLIVFLYTMPLLQAEFTISFST